MPDEILLKIAGYVKGWMPSSAEPYRFSVYSGNLHNIKHLRLTCQRLYDISSPFLIHFLTVSPQTSSLSRLEYIARHSTIRTGVQAVRLILSFYDSSFAEDINLFRDYAQVKLHDRLEELDDFTYSKDCVGFHAYLQPFPGKVGEVRAVLASWAKRLPSNHEPSTPEDQSAWLFLRRAHKEYRRRFKDQQTILENGQFIQRVASAFARMPNASRLEIYDGTRCWERDLHYVLVEKSDKETLINDLVTPFPWGEASELGLELPQSLDMVCNVPNAIVKAGGRIIAIAIVVSVPETFIALVPKDDRIRSLKKALRALQFFSFDLRGLNEPGSRSRFMATEAKNLEAFLAGFIDAETIQYLDLNFRALWEEEEPPTFGLNALIHPSHWAELSSISWIGMPFYLCELARFMHQLDLKTTYVSLDYMYLLDGAWRDALDILRGKLKVNRHWSLRNVSGADYHMLSDQVKTAVFGNPLDFFGTNEAERYLRGWRDGNPLRDDGAATGGS